MTPMVDVAFLLLRFFMLTRQYQQNSRLITLLKIDCKARYHSIIDLLDELQIANGGRFSILPMNEAEREILKNIRS